MFVTLKKDSKTKQVKTGFSWTTFFFGCFVPIFRMDAVFSVLYILAIVINAKVSGFEYFLTSHDSYFDARFMMFSSTFFVCLKVLFCCVYNKIYILCLLKKGYKPNDSLSKHKIETIKKAWPWRSLPF